LIFLNETFSCTREMLSLRSCSLMHKCGWINHQSLLRSSTD
jgi:hypothetical protein